MGTGLKKIPPKYESRALLLAQFEWSVDWRGKLNRKPVGNVYFMIQLTVIL
jgi:hypothetical protein